LVRRVLSLLRERGRAALSPPRPRPHGIPRRTEHLHAADVGPLAVSIAREARRRRVGRRRRVAAHRSTHRVRLRRPRAWDRSPDLRRVVSRRVRRSRDVRAAIVSIGNRGALVGSGGGRVMVTAESLGVPEIFNAAAHFVDRNVAEGRGGKIAIECGDERVTYDDLMRNVNRAGSALRNLGIRPEERVLLLLLDGPAFAYCFFGAIKIGAVPVPLITLWKPQDYAHVMQDSHARAIVASPELITATHLGAR